MAGRTTAGYGIYGLWLSPNAEPLAHSLEQQSATAGVALGNDS